MTKIKYMDFTLYKSDLIHYVHTAERYPNHYRDPDRLDYHVDRVVDTFIYALSKNQFGYDKKDEDMCGVIERLIKEYGCNTDGVYSEEAHLALQNIYKYNGLNPENAKLVTRQPTADWRDSFRSLGRAFSSFGTNIKISTKNLWNSTKNFLRKNTKYILGPVCLGVSLFLVKPAINFFSSIKKQAPVEVKTVTDSLKTSSDSSLVSWQEVAKGVQTTASKQEIKTDTVKKILENKSKYQKMSTAKEKSSQQAAKTTPATNKVITAKPASVAKIKDNKVVATKPAPVAKKESKTIGEQNTNYQQIAIKGLSQESAENLEKACNRAPTIVIGDLVKKGVLPANYRENTLKKYFEAHPKSHVSEVPSRILLQDIHNIYAHSQKDKLQELSDYVNSNQKRFLRAMRYSQQKLGYQAQNIKNLKQLRDLHNR